jgi:hypothetical protein
MLIGPKESGEAAVSVFLPQAPPATPLSPSTTDVISCMLSLMQETNTAAAC